MLGAMPSVLVASANRSAVIATIVRHRTGADRRADDVANAAARPQARSDLPDLLGEVQACIVEDLIALQQLCEFGGCSEQLVELIGCGRNGRFIARHCASAAFEQAAQNSHFFPDPIPEQVNGRHPALIGLRGLCQRIGVRGNEDGKLFDTIAAQPGFGLALGLIESTQKKLELLGQGLARTGLTFHRSLEHHAQRSALLDQRVRRMVVRQNVPLLIEQNDAVRHFLWNLQSECEVHGQFLARSGAVAQRHPHQSQPILVRSSLALRWGRSN